MDYDFDLIVVGSGPGGYVAAIRAIQLGLKVACVEKAELGGICLNWGCIPTKSLIKSAEVWKSLRSVGDFGITCENPVLDFRKVIQRSRNVAGRLSKGIEFLFIKNQISVMKGVAKLIDSHTVEVFDPEQNNSKFISAEHILIATGARAHSIPGVAIDGTRIISSREAMILPHVPESIIVIGAGAIGVEFAYLFNAFGAEVNIVEMLPQILPVDDEEISKELTRSFRKNKICVHTDSKVESVIVKDDSVDVTINANGVKKTLSAEYALMAIGVQANSENLGLEQVGVVTERGWIKVNAHYQTSISNIYAIGDVIGNPCLAHVAYSEGIHAIEFIIGKNPQPLNYLAIPCCTYCQPQVASVGLTEKKAVEEEYKLKIGRAQFRGNGKSMTLNEIDGFVKVLFDAETGVLLGAHIIGADATELLPELTLAVSNKMTFDELRIAVHAHPTLSEVIIEAIHDAYGEAVNK